MQPSIHSHSVRQPRHLHNAAALTRLLALTLAMACGGGGSTAPLDTGGHTTTNQPLVLEKLGTDPSSVVAGDAFPDSVRVRVHDASGAAKAGVSVTFAVVGGGGSISPSTTVTDAQGRAAARFVTGTSVGTNTASATLASGGSVQFTTATAAGPIASLAFASPMVVLDSATSTSVAATAHDKYGNVAPTGAITYTSRSSGVASANGPSVAAVAPGQAFIVATSGSVSDSMLVIVSHDHGPVVRTDLTRFILPTDTTITVGIVADMRSSGLKLGSAGLTVRFDPGLLALSSNQAAAGAVVNATSAGDGRVAIAVASASGLEGTPVLATLTFRVIGSAGHSGAIALETSELTAQDFQSLTARTLSASEPFVIR